MCWKGSEPSFGFASYLPVGSSGNTECHPETATDYKIALRVKSRQHQNFVSKIQNILLSNNFDPSQTLYFLLVVSQKL